jgi:hypothetical protein
MMWSAQQQSMLNAMGYTVYTKPGMPPALRENPLQDTVQRAVVTQNSALYTAVVKAAQGRDILPLNIDVDALRTSPQAKRALWPQLRRLMKT